MAGTFGPATQVVGYECLANRLSHVARLRLAGAGAVPSSVIVKHLKPGDAEQGIRSAQNVYFAEELAAHRFLQRIDGERDIKPRLLAADDRGVLLMEDLGSVNQASRRPFAFLVPALAQTFARLHARSTGRQDVLAALRRDIGLPDVAEDMRHSGNPIQAKVAELGRDHLVNEARRLNGVPEPLRAELDRAFAVFADAGAMNLFIHDDVAHSRQTFDVGSGVLILDFEHARYSHALLDICRLLLGKYEIEGTTGRSLWLNPSFPLELLHTYRRCLEDETGERVPDDAWKEMAASVMLLSVCGLIGYLILSLRERPLLATPRQNVNGLLFRLGELFGDWAPFPVMRAFIPRYLGLPSIAWVNGVQQQVRDNAKLARHATAVERS
jgi:hypothetical protein